MNDFTSGLGWIFILIILTPGIIIGVGIWELVKWLIVLMGG